MTATPLQRLLCQTVGLAWVLVGLAVPASAVQVSVSLDWVDGFTAKDSSGNNLGTNGVAVQLGWFTGVASNNIGSTVNRSNLGTYFNSFASTNFLGIPAGSDVQYAFDGNNTTVDEYLTDANGNQVTDPDTGLAIPTGNDPATKTTLYMVITSGLGDLGIFKWARSAVDFFFPRDPGTYTTDKNALTTQVGTTSFNTVAVIGTVSTNGLTLANTGGAVTPSITIAPGSANIATAFTTTYGTASAAQTFGVSGVNLTADFVATAPTGFEVSSDGTTYGSTATFAQAGGSASGTLRVRLAASASVSGSYNSQNIVLSSTGAASVNVTTAASGNSVSAKALTISGLTAANKDFDGTTAATVTGTPAYVGLVNGETFSVSGTVTWTFPDAAVGSGKTLSRSSSYNAPSANYTVTQPTLTASILALPTLRLLSIGTPVFTNGNTTITHTFSGNSNASYVFEFKTGLTNTWQTNAVAVGSSTNFSVTFTNRGVNSTNDWKNRMFFRVKNG